MTETEVTTGLSPAQRKGLDLARRAAGRAVHKRVRVARLARASYQKLKKNPEALGRLRGDVGALLRLALAWSRKEYRAVPWRSLLYAVAALIYFVNPVDLIPDALLGIGYVDDIAVITAIVRALQGDLERFLSWEADTAPPPDALTEGSP